MGTKVVYVTPECGIYIGELEVMTQEELLILADSREDIFVYSLSEFQEEFNAERISDLGFIFFINKNKEQ